MLRLHHVALHCASLLCRMVEIERALGLGVVVAPIAQRVVGADEDIGAAAGELGRGVLLLVVLLVCGCEVRLYVAIDDRLDCLGDVRKLRRVSIQGPLMVTRAGRTSPGGADSTKEPSADDLDMVYLLWPEGVPPMRCGDAMGLFAPCLGLLRGPSWRSRGPGRAGLMSTSTSQRFVHVHIAKAKVLYEPLDDR